MIVTEPTSEMWPGGTAQLCEGLVSDMVDMGRRHLAPSEFTDRGTSQTSVLAPNAPHRALGGGCAEKTWFHGQWHHIDTAPKDDAER